MKPHQTLFVLLLALALTACTQPAAAPSATVTPLPPTRTPAPSATATPIPFTATHSPVPTLTPSPTVTPPPVRLAQLAEWELDAIYYSAAWLPDSQSIVFSGYEAPDWSDESIYRYTIDPPQLSWQILGGGSGFAASPDGMVIAGRAVQALTLWDAQSGQTVRGPYYGEYFGPGGDFPVFLPDGSGLLVGHTEYYDVGWSETRIDLWDYEQGDYDPVSESPIIESDGFLNVLADSPLAISSNGELLVAFLGNLLGADGFKFSQVVIWELPTGNQRCAILGDDFTLSPTEKIIAITDQRWIGTEPPIGTPAPQRASREELTLYDTDTCQPLQTLYQAKYILHPTYSPDGKIIALVSPYGSASEWILIIDAATGELLWKQTGPWSHIWQLTFSPDGKYLLSIESYGTRDKLHIWQVIPAASP